MMRIRMTLLRTNVVTAHSFSQPSKTSYYPKLEIATPYFSTYGRRLYYALVAADFCILDRTRHNKAHELAGIMVTALDREDSYGVPLKRTFNFVRIICNE